jgi:hypothetical protein
MNRPDPGEAEGLLGSRFISGTLVAIAALGRSLGTARFGKRADEFARLESALIDLSRIFYYAEEGAKVATLRDELGFADRYLRLQALRFDGRLSYRVAAEEGTLDFYVPRLASFGPLERAVADALERSTGSAFIAVETVSPKGGEPELRIARGSSSAGPLEEVREPRVAKRRRIHAPPAVPSPKALSRNSRSASA